MSTEPLFALLEVMLNLTTPKVTPGGYTEEMFVDVTDQERDELSCSICYQLIKDARQCVNKHRFCYSCIFVWSTSGPSSNHGRCPVCRVDGDYLGSKDIDDSVQKKSAKCSMKSCKWVGPLKELGSHKHTTYNKLKKTFSPKLSENKENAELPKLNLGNSTKRNKPKPPVNIAQRNPPSRLRYTLTQRAPHTENVQRLQVGQSNTIPGPSSNSSRSASVRELSSTSNTPRTPRPPAAPRPDGLTYRRRPILPSIVNPPHVQQHVEHDSGGEARSTSSSSDSSLQSHSSLSGYGNIGTRLRQSRNRLDDLMTVFNTELERGHREIVDFQEEREVRRQAQLDEIRDLGHRLGQVATELRRLLDHRRQIRNQLDELADI